MSAVLIVEDEKVIRGALRRLLERHGYRVSEAGSLEQARREFAVDGFDLVLADLRLPDAPGTELIALATPKPVLIMTSYASVSSAVQAMKLGAADYIAKPFEHEELLLLVERTLRQHAMLRQHTQLKSEVSRHYPVDGMVGECRPMQQVFERIHKVAPTDSTVLILGESGTGKELVARAVHEHSPRRTAPFITVNCAAIPEGLIESELFGHEKGAFTGAQSARVGLVEAAAGGTLFLDEIGELPTAAQARLLRVLQQGEIRRIGASRERRIDVRLIAATHSDLQQQVDAQQFRSDLYFRLRVVEIALPPLRARGGDLFRLADFLLARACERLNRPPLRLSRDALALIGEHRWPGNVRELENAIERAVILCETDAITPQLLGIAPAAGPAEPPATSGAEGCTEPEALLSLDDYFVRFVRRHEDRMTETELARRLGISRKTLWERRHRLNVPRRRESG